jgi:hypothetical protein
MGDQHGLGLPQAMLNRFRVYGSARLDASGFFLAPQSVPRLRMSFSTMIRNLVWIYDLYRVILFERGP